MLLSLYLKLRRRLSFMIVHYYVVGAWRNVYRQLIKGQVDTDYLSWVSSCFRSTVRGQLEHLLNHALTAIRHINKMGVVTLGSTFRSHIMDACMEDLAFCPAREIAR